jgi:hypothetical protein
MLQSKDTDIETLISLNTKERLALLKQLDNEIDLLSQHFSSLEKHKDETVPSCSILTTEEAAELYKIEIEVLSYIARYEISLLSGDVAQMNNALKAAWGLVYSVVEKRFDFQRNEDDMNPFFDQRIRNWFIQIWHEYSIQMAEHEIIH